jgi:hypothetical protein
MSNTNSEHARGECYLRRGDAAAYVTRRYGFPCSRQWLAKLAVIGGGPVFRKAGRYPIYHPADLDRWAQARIGPAQCSTSHTSGEAHSKAKSFTSLGKAAMPS